ncbi:hypothetical protein NDU88_003068 [Pleurodeles waltl]|uniref:Uncharacterized protein n=1 Tax=Pleurodeles waltl TaxID=8319 RepID=A0AAV7QDS3_PLEWA|nr:hypothetical protein NDU88_003068 [Pleurodeles waltl]
MGPQRRLYYVPNIPVIKQCRRTERGRPMGVRGRKKNNSNGRAPAHRSMKQGHVWEGSAGPVHARQPPQTSGWLRRTRRGRGVEPLPRCR